MSGQARPALECGRSQRIHAAPEGEACFFDLGVVGAELRWLLLLTEVMPCDKANRALEGPLPRWLPFASHTPEPYA
jgi:hypothetical protein